jgi:hypothetical protein
MAKKLTGQTVRVMRFQDLDESERYDGVWACASLLHVPTSEMDDVIHRLARSLKPGGILYITLKSGDGEEVDSNGRLFNFYTPRRLRETLAQQPLLEVINTWQRADTRAGFEDQQWTHGLARRR